MIKKNIFENWEKETENIVKIFTLKYFGKDTSDIWWVAEEIGGVLVINDYFFGLLDIIDFIRYNYSKQEMFDYYDYSLKRAELGVSPINIKNWKKLEKEESAF